MYRNRHRPPRAEARLTHARLCAAEAIRASSPKIEIAKQTSAVMARMTDHARHEAVSSQRKYIRVVDRIAPKIEATIVMGEQYFLLFLWVGSGASSSSSGTASS